MLKLHCGITDDPNFSAGGFNQPSTGGVGGSYGGSSGGSGAGGDPYSQGTGGYSAGAGGAGAGGYGQQVGHTWICLLYHRLNH